MVGCNTALIESTEKSTYRIGAQRIKATGRRGVSSDISVLVGNRYRTLVL